MFAENNFHRQTYDLDLLPLYLFFILLGYLFLETLFWLFKINNTKIIINVCLILFFVSLYFILPHRESFN